MKYKTKVGIVLTEIGGKSLLVSAEALRAKIPYITEINDTAAACWRLLEDGLSESDLIHHFLDEYDADGELISADIHRLLDTMLRDGYLEVC